MENKFDKNLEDLGWSEMQKILDRELPLESKKKRRALLFWLFFAGVLTTFGIAFLFFNSKNKNQELIVENNKKESNFKSNYDDNSINLIQEKKLIKTNKKELILNNNSPQLMAKKELNNANKNELIKENNRLILNENTSQLMAKNDSIQTNKLVDNTVVLNTHLNTEINKEFLNITAQTTENATAKLNEAPPQYFGENSDFLKSENRQNIEAIPSHTVDYQLVNTYDSAYLSKAIQSLFWVSCPIRSSVSNPKRTHFGITTGAHTEGVQKIDGGQIGLVLNRELNRKWAISIGLNYRKTNVNVDSLLGNNSGLSYVTFPTSTNPKYSSNSTKKILLNNLNYAELPINLTYNFNKKISFSAGIKAAYLLSSNIGVSADSTVYFLTENLNKINAYSDPSYDKTARINALGLQNFDVAIMGGINYQITPKIQLNLTYHHGFKNVINRANWAAYNRFLGLNVVYYFK